MDPDRRRWLAKCSRQATRNEAMICPLLLSTAKAERVEGGFKFSGHKMFGSLAPVWNSLWTARLVGRRRGRAKGSTRLHAARIPSGYKIVETWDTLGMRGTRSDDVVLDGAFVPDNYIARTLPAGGADQFIVAVFAWALMGFANIYYGMAQRACHLAIEAVKSKKSVAVSRTMAYHPEIQHAIAQMTLALDSVGPHLDHVAREWSAGVDHGATWPSKIVSAKHHAVEACWKIVDLAMEVSGGTGMFRRANLSGCSVMPVAGAFIRQTRCLSMRSWPKRLWASTSVNNHAGDDDALWRKTEGETVSAAVMAHARRILVATDEQDQYEGASRIKRTVILEFPSKELWAGMTRRSIELSKTCGCEAVQTAVAQYCRVRAAKLRVIHAAGLCWAGLGSYVS